MFEELKQRPRGFQPKEKARLYVTVAACLALGTLVFGGHGCEDAVNAPPPTANPSASGEPAEPTGDEPKALAFDLGPLAAFRTKCPDPSAFDVPALEHTLSQVLRGKLRREPDLVLAGPAEVRALSCEESVGKTIEVAGTIRRLDREAFRAVSPMQVDRLWSFALEGDDGKTLAVVHPGLASNPDEDKPFDVYHPNAAREPLQEGARIRVRGVYLQQRTGSVGLVTLDGPTPMLVGREYRRAVVVAAPIATLAAADWAGVNDRFLENTRVMDLHFGPDPVDTKSKVEIREKAYYQVLAWIRAKGHDQIVKELRDGTLRYETFGQGRFHDFGEDLKIKDDGSGPDPRVTTLGYRGKIYVTTGLLADFLKEDWDTVAENASDVSSVYRSWLISHYYGNAPIPFDGVFPRETYRSIAAPVDGPGRQRVKAYGIFYKSYSFSPSGADDPKKLRGRKKESTVPGFILLHLEPDVPVRMAPLLENPFFWISASLMLFGAVFFFVMSRIERKESSAIREQNLRIKRRQRETGAVRGGPPSPEKPPGEPPP